MTVFDNFHTFKSYIIIESYLWSLFYKEIKLQINKRTKKWSYTFSLTHQRKGFNLNIEKLLTTVKYHQYGLIKQGKFA